MNPYISDILSQPAALREAVKKYSPDALAPIATGLQNGEFDRLVITGMGASYNAAYPAYLELSGLPIPVVLVNAAELVHYMNRQIGARTLLWANSQSGRSAELLHLLQRIGPTPPACLLASVNDEASSLATAADICLPVHAGPESTVSTKTYVNTLGVNLLAAQQLAGRDIEPLKVAMLTAADGIEHFLSNWQARVNELDAMLGNFETLILLGRGASMSAVWNGALTSKEAAKFSLEGMNAAEFRHGPLELASPGFTALIFAGSSETMQHNHNLALDVFKHDGRALWVDTENDVRLPTILVPSTDELVRPLVEILPMQLLTLVLADRNNVTAGQFRIIGKVTTVE
jgi:glucosamine--fructose-6-phosphate aminotransferase (isomerizing)